MWVFKEMREKEREQRDACDRESMVTYTKKDDIDSCQWSIPSKGEREGERE